MNICFINNLSIDPQKGGIERVTQNLCSEFLNMGHNVICFYLEGKSDPLNNISQYKLINNHSFDTKNNIDQISTAIERNQIDIVINQAAYKASSVSLCNNIKRETGVKVITTWHSDPLSLIHALKDDLESHYEGEYLSTKDISKNIINLLKYPISRYLRRSRIKKHFSEIYKNSDSFVLLSNKFIVPVQKILGGRKLDNLTAISNPIPVSDLNIKWHNKKNKILYVGRLCHSAKRVDRLLKIWQYAYPSLLNWELKIVGGGEDSARLKNLANYLGLKNISFEGQQDPQKYFQESKIICLTSTYEGFGMVLVEGQQHGCIPIAFNSFASVNDIIEDNISGVLVHPFDLKEYAYKLTELCLDIEKQQDMSKNCISSSSLYDSKKIASEWLRLFESLKVGV